MKQIKRCATVVLLAGSVIFGATKQIDARLYPTVESTLADGCADSLDTVLVHYRGSEVGSIPCKGRTIAEEQQAMPELPAGFGIDLTVEPLVWFQFGRFDDPIESAIGIMPRARFHFWKGAMLDLRPNITFRDEFHTNRGYQGGLYVASQLISPTEGQFFTGSFGAFTADRWGFDGHWIGVFADKRLFTELQIGGTGYLSFDDSLYTFSPLDRATGVGRIGWYVASLNLLAQIEGGRYLWKDWGGGMTLDRQFGQMHIALSGLYTPRGVNGGFTITVPLWKGKHPHVGRVRFGFSDSYRFRYRFKGYQPSAHLYETGTDVIRKVIEYQTVTKKVEN